MKRKRIYLLAALAIALLALLPGLKQPLTARAVPETYASPVHAGCYLASRETCKIHVDPFSINLASGADLMQYRLVARRARDDVSTVIYDFRTDVSNPPPSSGSPYIPSLVAKDFAARCGESYTVTLEARDTSY